MLLLPVNPVIQIGHFMPNVAFHRIIPSIAQRRPLRSAGSSTNNATTHICISRFNPRIRRMQSLEGILGGLLLLLLALPPINPTLPQWPPHKLA